MKKIILPFISILLMCCAAEPLSTNTKQDFNISEGLLEGLQFDKNEFSKTYAITSSSEWEIKSRINQLWINISPSKGSGNSTITVTADVNDSGLLRRAFFDVKVNGEQYCVIEIIQTATGEILPDTPGETPVEDKVFPILAWEDVPADKAAERFPSMKAAGINTYLGIYESKDAALEILDVAENVGVKVFVQCPELLTDPGATVRALMNHSALAGYFVEDEPEISDIVKWAGIVKEIQSVDDKHPCYINLYPTYAWGKDGEKYAANVDAFISAVPLPIISFDHYPVVSLNGEPNSLRYDWFLNLEIIAAASKKYQKPMWAFARVNSRQWNEEIFYPVPTTEELRMQMFTNLAYGAQCLQYFTYWGLETNNGKTRAYERAQTVNAEVQAFSEVFLGCDVISVGHTGDLPLGTREVAEFPSVFTKVETSGGAIVSHIENGEKNYLVIVNRSISEDNVLSISAESSVKRVIKNGETEEMTAEYDIEPGNMEIFTWNK